MSQRAFVINFQGAKIKTTKKFLTGVELRAMLGVPEGFDLVVERPEADVLLHDFEVVQLDDHPVYVFARPPTQFG